MENIVLLKQKGRYYLQVTLTKQELSKYNLKLGQEIPFI